MKMIRRAKDGFTLIELMIVVAIIGILAAIAIPQFAQLIAKSQEGATKGNLGSIRSALSIYYGDTEGVYPTDLLTSLTASQKYLSAIPVANLPKTNNNTGHASSSAVASSANLGTTGVTTDNGGWVYDNSGLGGSSTWGEILLDCTHSDSKGKPWTGY